MPTARRNLGAVAHQGKVYVVGGYTGSYTSVMECLDLATNTWTKYPPMLTPRWATATVLVGDFIYVLGGQGSSIAAERFNLATNVWEKCPPLARTRDRPAAAVLRDCVYVIGGDTKIVERLDPAKEPLTWERVASTSVTFNDCCAVAVQDRIYVVGFGTTSTERYNPDMDTWDTVAPIPMTRDYMCAVAALH